MDSAFAEIENGAFLPLPFVARNFDEQKYECFPSEAKAALLIA